MFIKHQVHILDAKTTYSIKMLEEIIGLLNRSPAAAENTSSSSS
jgi:hypothetical protein